MQVDVSHIYLPVKMEQTECSETSAYKTRRRVITQKKAYNIQNTAKAWNQELQIYLLKNLNVYLFPCRLIIKVWHSIYFWSRSFKNDQMHNLIGKIIYLIFSELVSFNL